MHPAYRKGDTDIDRDKRRDTKRQRDRTQDVGVRKFNGREASLQPNYM